MECLEMGIKLEIVNLSLSILKSIFKKYFKNSQT